MTTPGEAQGPAAAREGELVGPRNAVEAALNDLLYAVWRYDKPALATVMAAEEALLGAGVASPIPACHHVDHGHFGRHDNLQRFGLRWGTRDGWELCDVH